MNHIISSLNDRGTTGQEETVTETVESGVSPLIFQLFRLPHVFVVVLTFLYGSTSPRCYLRPLPLLRSLLAVPIPNELGC